MWLSGRLINLYLSPQTCHSSHYVLSFCLIACVNFFSFLLYQRTAPSHVSRAFSVQRAHASSASRPVLNILRTSLFIAYMHTPLILLGKFGLHLTHSELVNVKLCFSPQWPPVLSPQPPHPHLFPSLTPCGLTISMELLTTEPALRPIRLTSARGLEEPLLTDNENKTIQLTQLACCMLTPS